MAQEAVVHLCAAWAVEWSTEGQTEAGCASSIFGLLSRRLPRYPCLVRSRCVVVLLLFDASRRR